MNTASAHDHAHLHHLLRFRSLFDEGRGLAFPCDEQGHVDMDHLSDAALNNYLFARATVGREFFAGAVEPQLC